MTTRSNGTPIPENVEDLLSCSVVAHVATKGPDGAPQSNPVWFDSDGELVKFSQTRKRQKLRNVSRDPRVTLSIVDPENRLRYLEIRGEVEMIEEDPDFDFISAMFYVRPRHTTQMDG